MGIDRQYGLPERRVIDALKEAQGALMFLLQQGLDLGFADEARLRVAEELVEKVLMNRTGTPDEIGIAHDH